MNNFIEEWRDIPTWEGIFQMSNFGRVRNLITGNISVGARNKETGYYQVRLNWKGRDQQPSLHRLMAKVWLGGISKNEVAHHKNRLKCCNCIHNIQVMDKKQHHQLHLDEKTNISRSQKLMGHSVSEETKRKLSEAKQGKDNLTEQGRMKLKNSAYKRKDPNTGRFVKIDK